MHNFEEIFTNGILWSSIFACFLAQALKIAFHFFKNKELDFTKIMGSGGMPSSHSALVCCLTTMIGLEFGFNSAAFATCTVFSTIIMYDAAGVRKAVGEQAKILNRIRKKLENREHNIDEDLKELIGHTRLEVFAGAFLGILIGILFSIPSVN